MSSQLTNLEQNKESNHTSYQHLVINGHGSKTNTTFEMNNHVLLTPGDLTTSYVFSVDPNYSIEKDFNEDHVKPVTNGHWTFYDKAHTPVVPEVKMGPWNYNETKSFASNILKDPSFWSTIDGQHQYYLDRDPDAQLILKQGKEYLHLNASETKEVLQKITQNTYDFESEGTPLFFYAPKVGKVKILSETSLSEVLTQVEEIAGPQLVMLATCNASHHNTTISYNTQGKDISVSDLAKQQSVLLLDEHDATKADSYLEMSDLSNKQDIKALEPQKNNHETIKLSEVISADHSPAQELVSFSNAPDLISATPVIHQDIIMPSLVANHCE